MNILTIRYVLARNGENRMYVFINRGTLMNGKLFVAFLVGLVVASGVTYYLTSKPEPAKPAAVAQTSNAPAQAPADQTITPAPVPAQQATPPPAPVETKPSPVASRPEPAHRNASRWHKASHADPPTTGDSLDHHDNAQPCSCVGSCANRVFAACSSRRAGAKRKYGTGLDPAAGVYSSGSSAASRAAEAELSNDPGGNASERSTWPNAEFRKEP